MDKFFTKTDAIVQKYILDTPIVKLLKRKVVLRKVITFSVMLLCWIALLAGAWFSPKRITYTEEQLATTRTFSNKTGQVLLKSQSYDYKTGIVLLEFETTDYTSAISKGINANNLEWRVYTKNGIPGVEMQVYPLTDNKITIAIKNIPDGFEALAISLTNNTTPLAKVDVSIKDYDKEKSSSSSEKDIDQQEEDKVADNNVKFIITTQTELLKEEKIANLSREEFSLKIFNEELDFQMEQQKRITDSITSLQELIKEDKETIETLRREAQYLIGSKLTGKQKEIETVEKSIESKKSQVLEAEGNLTSLQLIIDKLQSNIEAIKDGTYQFNAPVTSTNANF